ncbi:Transposase DNA-binding [Enterovibrio nigricans DSM 22720]|uniref:Transposase DNA-binding n=1 Tax=Enterovibrio nigricans DSM 22720 TaxID=1121868 RepID=A0A1T4VDP2_9GAMM|nr:Transposase DNA-binding [Enterovibrio nigricans DSM 22720]
MMMNPELWAKCQFGQANLNDPRCTQRLVSLTASIAQQPGIAVSRLALSPAEMEGAYHFIRNGNIQASDIVETGFLSIAQQANAHNTLLALEETTPLIYKHDSVRDSLGHANQGDKLRAIQAHPILLYAPQSQQVIGLIEQQLWRRNIKKRGQSHQHATRPYEEKRAISGNKPQPICLNSHRLDVG